MNIKELIKEAHENAVERGFYDCPKCAGSGAYPIEPDGEPEQCRYCDVTGIDPNKNIGEKLMLIVSELGEALEAHRCGQFAHWKLYERDVKDHTCLNKSKHQFNKARIVSFMDHIKDTFEDEIADVFIRLFDFCGYLGITPNRFDELEMQSMDNIGHEFLWMTGLISSLPGFIEWWEQTDDIKKEIRDMGLIIKRLRCFCEKLNIPIEKHIKAKMAYNRTRPHKHGKDYG